ncbi:MAG: argininosuccinate synthase domain-containing protein, partial [Rikenellaceae bacterium]
MNQKRAILAFSGGIDSSAAVEILQSEGYEITALMLSLNVGDEEQIYNARQRAEELGVEFVVKDCRELFEREIINNFVREYVAGRTPAPCTRCNPLIKWRVLVEYAKSVGAEHIATGHYFSTTLHRGKIYVSRAKDPRKDQSYYLWGVSQEALGMALTPMSDKIKEDIKQKSTLKKESMGVCFLQGGHYSELISSRGGRIEGGDIVDAKGDVVGKHRGLAFYTIGQKRGEGIPSGVAVTAIDAAKNQITVGEDAELYSRTLTIRDCNVIDEQEWLTSPNITVMVRGLGRNPEGYARVEKSSHEGEYIIHLESPAWACAQGQPVVLYVGDRVIGIASW